MLNSEPVMPKRSVNIQMTIKCTYLKAGILFRKNSGMISCSSVIKYSLLNNHKTFHKPQASIGKTRESKFEGQIICTPYTKCISFDYLSSYFEPQMEPHSAENIRERWWALMSTRENRMNWNPLVHGMKRAEEWPHYHTGCGPSSSPKSWFMIPESRWNEVEEP